MFLSSVNQALAIVLVVLSGLFAFALAAFITITIRMGRILNERFGGRWNLPAFTLTEFPGLDAEKRTFKNQRKVELVGYLYTGKKRRGEAPRGLLVFAPGFSSPHRQYLFYIQALCEAGFTVFSYDNTAVGESGGTGLGGLEQAVYDLRAGLELTAADPALSTLPLYLSGHSMGAYAAAAILCEKHLPVHAPVKGIIALSGINRPIEMELLHMGALKPFIYLPLRWTALVNWGRVAGYSAAKGLQRAAWGTRALFVYSGGDPVIPLSLYQRLERSLERCRQVQFLRLEGRGHIPYVPAGQWPLIEARQKAGPRPGEAQGDVDQACLELERGLDATFWTAVEGFLNT